MTWAAVAVAGAAVVGGVISSSMQADAAESAANKQLQATTQGQDLMREMYAKNAPYWTPYTNLGPQGVNQITSLLPYLTHQFGPSDLQTNLAPNYKFMLGQGLQAQRQTQNVGGGGSNISRAADIFSQNYAQNAYQQAFKNFNDQRTGIYNTLASIANIGQQGAAGLSNLGTGTATNIANLGILGATASGAGQIGAANAWAGGIQNAVGNIGNAAIYSSLAQNQGNQVTNTPYTSQTPTGPGTYNVGGGEMVITPVA